MEVRMVGSDLVFHDEFDLFEYFVLADGVPGNGEVHLLFEFLGLFKVDNGFFAFESLLEVGEGKFVEALKELPVKSFVDNL